jgi:probable phosphoglycerate mutase
MNWCSNPGNKAMETFPALFGLIRHSLTEWNIKKRIQGHQNSPLSEIGRKMAAAWGYELQGFHWNRILTSDLGRAQETAELINQRLQLPLHVDQLLREQNWGEWSGLSFPELFRCSRSEIEKQKAAGWNFRPPGGESRKEVLARAQQALQNAAATWPDENILIITHEGIIKSLLYHLLDRSFLSNEPNVIKGYQLHLVQNSQGQPVLISMNHLALTEKAGNSILRKELRGKRF